MVILIGVLLGAAVVALIVWQVLLRRNHAALPREVSLGLVVAKTKRKEWRGLTKEYERRVKAVSGHFSTINDPQGRMLKSLGGVTLYERWITTPQGAGSLIGVKAEASDESNIRRRVTATRLVTLGVFALAAPKKKGTGNSYVVIEGSSVSGFASINAQNNQNVGPQAFAFAAEINNAARAAEAAQPHRPQAIEAARQALMRAKDDSDVTNAKAAYGQAVAALPPEYRLKFRDAPTMSG